MTVQDVVNRINARISEIEVELAGSRLYGERWYSLSSRKKELIALRDSILEGIGE